MRILVVGPHPDDQELTMGGTIAKLASSGHDVLLLDVTNGEPTPFGTPERRAQEAAEAARVLGVRRHALGLPNRRVEHTIDARHRLAAVIRTERIDVMFVPFPEDAHPDHRAVTRIAEDARFDAKLTKVDLPGEPRYPKWLFHYYCTHLRIVPQPSFLIDTSGFAERKRAAIMAYHSQFVENEKNRGVPDWIAASDRYFGSRIGTESAEPFSSPEPIGLHDLTGLV
ncbi:MAG: PIG-L family deacetylase [Phycisphaerae bacterium]|jgi:bacillithiol biosynthesis deacetylase BshB1|nr:PIG-L family deacetylase [Phycisphaerae bacterium]